MAQGRLRGLSISLDLETAKLDRSLSQVKRSFRDLNSSLKVNLKNFQYGEKDLKSYRQASEDLTDAIEIQEKNVEELGDMWSELTEEQQQNSIEGSKIRQEYNKQVDILNLYKARLSDIQDELKSLETANSSIGRMSQRLITYGDSLSSIGSSLTSFGDKTEQVGKSLTRKLTLPAVGAATAIGGMTAKLGFDRLVGLDSAQAKLKGLGYNAKEVEKVSGYVENAIEGSMTTMAEGTDVAAGALAAGVKEGKDLEKFIKLVGDAAVGSNRPVSEMAMIFNRVQGSGKLMTEELNSIEGGMPGFANAMAKHLKVPQDEFRKMVSEGKVSSNDFLTVMDDFAGGMAGSYANSWQGMVKNTKAYIGIIGQNLLSGVFEQSKDSLKEFENIMKSPALQNWAKETGEKLAAGLENVGRKVNSLINWWKGLDSETQNSLGNIAKWAGITLVTVGPMLTIFGKLTKVIGGTFSTFGFLTSSLGKVTFEAKESGSVIKGITNVFPKLGATIGALSGPLGWTVLGIAALGTAFVVAYKKSETFRNIVNTSVTGIVNTFKAAKEVVKGFFQLFKGNGQDGVITLSKILPPDVVVGLTNFADKVKEIFFQVVDSIKQFSSEIGKQLSTFWKQNGSEITEAVKNIGHIISVTFNFIWNNAIKPIMGLIWNIMKFIWPSIKLLIIDTWENIKNIIKGSLDVVLGTVKIFSSLFTANWSGVWQGIKQVTSGALKLIWAAVQLWLVGKILKVARLFSGLFRNIFSSVWKIIKNIFDKTLGAIYRTTIRRFKNLSDGTKLIFKVLREFISVVWDSIKKRIVNSAQSILGGVRTRFSNLLKSVKTIFSNLRAFSVKLWTSLKNSIVKFSQSIWTNVRNRFSGMYKSVRSIFNSLFNFGKKLWTSLRNTIRNLAQSIWTNVKNKFTGMFKSVKSITTNLFNSVRNLFTRIKNSATNLAQGARDNVANAFKSMYEKGKSWLNTLKNFITNSISGFKKEAGKLGKGVANGAIEGLNGMIKGINKLSSKIMGKNLISKEIPRLSTGTGTSPNVDTDQNGLLKRRTRAIVNDKGPGNGRGPNGHKELIYRRSGKIEQPKGRNRLVTLNRGDGVINGAQTQSFLPRLSTGTVMSQLFGSGAKSTNKKKKNVFEKAWDGAGNAYNSAVESTKSAGKKIATVTGKGIDAVMKGIGDVWDYASNPKKLIDKVLNGMGINFDGIGGAMGGFMKWSAKKLRTGMIDLVTGWFEDESGGGDGSSFTKFGKSTPYSPNAPVPGYGFNGGRHYGIDYVTPSGTTINAPTSGVVSKLHNHGGGLVAKLLSGKFTQFFMHLSSILKTGRVKQGEPFAKTGNSGAWTTGPHLHYQVEKGNSADITNRNTMDPEKFLSGKAGGSKAASKWAPEIRKAAKRMKVNLTSRELQGIIAQIDRESSGNAGVTQGNIGDINNLRGTPAQGLLQYVPSTFRAYSVKGHNNIKSGYDQLLAFFNNSNWRRDLPYGRSGWGPTGKRRFATGGIIRTNGLYNLAEEGHEEVVIPTDPKRSSDAMKLINYAANKVQGKQTRNKRPGQVKNYSLSNQSYDSNNELIRILTAQVQRQDKQIDLLTKIVLSTQSIEKQPKGYNNDDISKGLGRMYNDRNYTLGGAY